MFTLRTFHLAGVWMLGPEANRFMLVTDRDKFIWRDGLMGDLIPLIGDGLLTTDGEYHDEARRIMMPAFHRDHVVATTAIDDRGGRPRARRMAARRPRRPLRLGPPRRDADRDAGALRARPGRHGRPRHRPASSSAGSPSTATEFVLQVLRGPGAPFERVKSARRILDRILGEEIARRRAGTRATTC